MAVGLRGTAATVPAVVLPYAIRPAGGPPYQHVATIPLNNAAVSTMERLTPLIAWIANGERDTPAFDGVQPVEAVVRAYEEQMDASRKLTLEAADRAWIDGHGSRRLQQGVARGFDMHDLYLEERLTAEFPGVDATARLDGAVWRALCSEPTLRALETLGTVEAALALSGDEHSDVRISLVRLAEEPYGYRMFQQRCWEAVLVERWLSRVTVLIGVPPQPVATYDEREF